MYRERMNGYYPEVIRAILEYQGIVDAEYPEFELANGNTSELVNDAYLYTMSETRVKQWEKVFGITPYKNSTLQDRRETIIARIRGQGKLNTATIEAIVTTFTGGNAKSWIKDSVIHVLIDPPAENKTYYFTNVEQELANKVPAHLGLEVKRNYITWGDLPKVFTDWGHLKSFAFSDENGVLTRLDGSYDLDENGGLNLDATWGDIVLLTPSLLGIPES